MSLWVAAYDIAHDGSRVKVAKILASFGQRVQHSVFEVWLKPGQVKDLRHRVGRHLAKTDRFHLFPIDERGDRRRIAWQTPPNPYAAVIVVAPKAERRGPVPGGKIFRVDDLPQVPPWNRLYRLVKYMKVEVTPKEDLPYTLADPMDPLGCQDWPEVDIEPDLTPRL